MQTLSVNEARRIALFSQRLHSRRQFSASSAGALEAIEHLGYLQIDTLAVVQRAHNHTLWNRVPGFKPDMLDQLQQDKKIFEHWAHALAYLPMSDFRFSLPMMSRIANGDTHWYPKNSKETARVLKRIKEEGPLSAKDFSDKKTSSTMWARSPSKQALEQLFMEGALMIPRRINFHKVYDLTERVLPENVSTQMPTTAEHCRHLIGRYLKAHGIGQLKEFAYLRKGLNTAIKQDVDHLVEAGEIIRVYIDGMPYFCDPTALEQGSRKLPGGLVRILSPFDNAVIQRKRVQQLFDFDYQIECYVPQAKRKFGYFCLPILYNGNIVGRLDAKADRAGKVLRVLQLHIEKPLRSRDAFYSRLEKELYRFAKFNDCDDVVMPL